MYYIKTCKAIPKYFFKLPILSVQCSEYWLYIYWLLQSIFCLNEYQLFSISRLDQILKGFLYFQSRDMIFRIHFRFRWGEISRCWLCNVKLHFCTVLDFARTDHRNKTLSERVIPGGCISRDELRYNALASSFHPPTPFTTQPPQFRPLHHHEGGRPVTHLLRLLEHFCNLTRIR